MSLISIDQSFSTGVNAGSKARNDATTILEGIGFSHESLNCTLDPNPLAIARDLFSMEKQLLDLIASLQPGDIALLQFPYRCFRTSTARKLSRIARARKIKLIALVHDLDSLRRDNALERIGSYSFTERLHCDVEFLRHFDIIIAHNAAMKGYLVSSGLNSDQVVELNLFDYLCDAPQRDSHSQLSHITIAGNLAPSKAGYLYHLQDISNLGDLVFDLYGNGYNNAEAFDAIKVHGAISPDLLPAAMPDGFGLVWDGPEIGQCSGAYGSYLMFNNPHKLSLYYASGLIPIVWAKSATASFVRETRSGICVDSLKSIPNAIGKLNESVLGELRANASSIQQQVTSGYYLKTAIEASLLKL